MGWAMESFFLPEHLIGIVFCQFHLAQHWTCIHKKGMRSKCKEKQRRAGVKKGQMNSQIGGWMDGFNII